ncbi:MAG: RICIN domain-containing protein [Haliscomenobacter sp.]|uniref:RICIN domain-containing protein n=1 Tax=Haliscomenobacter sp. TaxID=2717303 RepID=UPI0029A69811|nr:RICIN domain-containing protein [Haliscomenobacter sp.]MDX2071897.1 RICIN domain-containing protein [Haliscomenobacter sp.]
MRHFMIALWASVPLCLSLNLCLSAQPVQAPSHFKPNGSVQILQRLPVADGVYYLKVLNTGKYLGVAGIDTRNGAALIQWDFVNAANHKFELKNIGNNVFTLKAMHSGRYLNVAGQSLDDNAPITQWDYVNQANLHFSLVANDQGARIRCEQSQKYWNLYGGNHQNNNGIAVVQYRGTGPGFALEPAESGLKVNKDQLEKVGPALSRTFEKTRRTSDGVTLTSRYQIAPSLATNLAAKSGKAKIISNKPAPSSEVNCESSLIRISLDDNSFMTADIASQLDEVVPGSVFNILDYLSGSWKRQTQFLKPITLSSGVKNVIAGGSVLQEVNNPLKHNLQQAVANLYGQFSAEQNKQASLSYNATIKEVHNEADFQLQIGAGAHYMTYSIDNLFNFQRGSKSTYLLLDITKIMFTIEASAPEGGFFTDESLNQDPNLVYLKKADYGLRILASVEMKESSELIANKLKLSVNALVAGANVDLDMLSRELNQEMTIKMFVVGGQSRDVVSAYNLNDLKNKVQNLERNLTYHTCQPIRYVIATTRDNWVVSYNTATDEFIKQTCTLPAVQSAGANVELSGLMIKGGPEGGDLDMYGKVWVMAHRGDGSAIPAERGQNMLLDIPGEQSIDLDNPANTINPGSRVRFYFPPGTTEGAYIEVFFALFEKDANPDYAYGDGDDDHFVFRYRDQSKSFDTGKMSKRFCSKKFYLNELPKFDYSEEFSESSEVIQLTRLSISKTPAMQ